MSLLLLEQLMVHIAESETKMDGGAGKPRDAEDLRPSDYFDCIYGTSTGGIIATMLGRLHMTVPQCLEVYRTMGGTIFGRKRLIGRLPLATKYSSKKLEKMIRDTVKRHCANHSSCDGNDAFASNKTNDGECSARQRQHECKV